MKQKAMLPVLVALLLLSVSCASNDGRQAGDTNPGASIPIISGDYEVRRFIVETGVGRYEENVYLLLHSRSKQALLIDPGARSNELEEHIRRQGVQVVGVLNTHGHYDHIGANGHYRDLYQVDVYVDARDASLYLSQDAPVLPENAPTRDIPDPAQGALRIGELQVRVIPTPGHTPGSACFLVDRLLFSGDTLFRGTVGRTIDDAAARTLVTNVRDRLLVLPADTLVYPGHGDATTVGAEKEHNAFLRDL